MWRIADLLWGYEGGSRRKVHLMRTGGIGGSLLLIALGAVLYWAVNVDAEGMDLNLIGLILLVVGVVGLILTLIMTASADTADRSDRDVTIIER